MFILALVKKTSHKSKQQFTNLRLHKSVYTFWPEEYNPHCICSWHTLCVLYKLLWVEWGGRARHGAMSLNHNQSGCPEAVTSSSMEAIEFHVSSRLCSVVDVKQYSGVILFIWPKLVQKLASTEQTRQHPPFHRAVNNHHR